MFRASTRFAVILGLGAFPLVAQGQTGPRDCATIASVPLPASAIGLPTSGARVTGATPVGASGTAPRTIGAYCHVTADIDPVDRSAPPIKLEVNLPESWNGKALMYGGGGFNGTVLSSPGLIRLQPTDIAVPLGRGYATFASDSGHQGASTDASFARTPPTEDGRQIVAISSTLPGVKVRPLSEGTRPAALATAAISIDALVPSRKDVCM